MSTETDLRVAIQDLTKAINGLTKAINEAVITNTFKPANQVGVQKPATPSDASTLGDWRPFDRGGGHWIFANKNAPLRETLLAARAQGKDSVEMGGFRFKLSGDEDKFINRFPLEAKK